MEKRSELLEPGRSDVLDKGLSPLKGLSSFYASRLKKVVPYVLAMGVSVGVFEGVAEASCEDQQAAIDQVEDVLETTPLDVNQASRLVALAQECGDENEIQKAEDRLLLARLANPYFQRAELTDTGRTAKEEIEYIVDRFVLGGTFDPNKLLSEQLREEDFTFVYLSGMGMVSGASLTEASFNILELLVVYAEMTSDHKLAAMLKKLFLDIMSQTRSTRKGLFDALNRVRLIQADTFSFQDEHSSENVLRLLPPSSPEAESFLSFQQEKTRADVLAVAAVKTVDDPKKRDELAVQAYDIYTNLIEGWNDIEPVEPSGQFKALLGTYDEVQADIHPIDRLRVKVDRALLAYPLHPSGHSVELGISDITKFIADGELEAMDIEERWLSLHHVARAVINAASHEPFSNLVTSIQFAVFERELQKQVGSQEFHSIPFELQMALAYDLSRLNELLLERKPTQAELDGFADVASVPGVFYRGDLLLLQGPRPVHSPYIASLKKIMLRNADADGSLPFRGFLSGEEISEIAAYMHAIQFPVLLPEGSDLDDVVGYSPLSSQGAARFLDILSEVSMYSKHREDLRLRRIQFTRDLAKYDLCLDALEKFLRSRGLSTSPGGLARELAPERSVELPLAPGTAKKVLKEFLSRNSEYSYDREKRALVTVGRMNDSEEADLLEVFSVLEEGEEKEAVLAAVSSLKESSYVLAYQDSALVKRALLEMALVYRDRGRPGDLRTAHDLFVVALGIPVSANDYSLHRKVVKEYGNTFGGE